MATDGAAASGSLLDLNGAVFDGRFRVEERIAEGGFAVVYKAWQLALERRVALKVLKAPRQQDAFGRGEFRERFATEAKTIARLRHPDIVDVYDFSVATLPSGELAPWMALEWLEGETLAQQLLQRRRAGLRGREPWEAVELLRPVLRALAHAHELGIVHRDVKPSNIMVSTTAHGPSLRVLDFGIAKIMVDTRTPNTGNTRTESTPAFSPAYAAPEQVAFSRTGPWTDVHALGLILTEVMTDSAPFSERDPEVHLFEQVMAPERPTPGSRGRDVGAFEAVLAKAVALSPRDRFRNAGELLTALEDAKAGARRAASTTATGVVLERSAARPRQRAAYAVALGSALVVAAALGIRGWSVGDTAERVPALPTQAAEKGAVATPAAALPSVAATPAAASQPASAPTPTDAPARPEKIKPRAKPRQLAPSVTDGRELFNEPK